LGVADPITFLGHDSGCDWLIAQAVVVRAMELRREELKATAELIGNEVGRVVAKAFG